MGAAAFSAIDSARANLTSALVTPSMFEPLTPAKNWSLDRFSTLAPVFSLDVCSRSMPSITWLIFSMSTPTEKPIPIAPRIFSIPCTASPTMPLALPMSSESFARLASI